MITRRPSTRSVPTSPSQSVGPSTIIAASELATVLGIWAHPDDEAFLSAGLMAAARDAGQRVVCVTATLGEPGTDDPRTWPPQRLAAIRAHEIHASLAVLGVTEHHLVGIADGSCATQPHHAVVQRLVLLGIASLSLALMFVSGSVTAAGWKWVPPQPP